MPADMRAWFEELADGEEVVMCWISQAGDDLEKVVNQAFPGRVRQE